MYNKNKQYNDKEKESGCCLTTIQQFFNYIMASQRERGQTMIYKTLHRKLKGEQYELHRKTGVKSCAPEAKQFLFH